jgi:Calpain family cysteine protease
MNASAVMTGESKVGLANPYALAELAVGRKVNWKSVTDPEGFVEKTLGMSVEDLCAPVAGNMMLGGAPESRKMLAGFRETGKGAPETFKPGANDGPVRRMLANLSPDTQARIIDALAGGQKRAATGFTPAGAEWADPGDFFHEGAEFFDPCQGALGDCYFIAALSAVAWSRPYEIAHRERDIGPGPNEVVDRIDFHSGGLKSIEVTERMPVVQSTHAWIYARSSEPGEIWPAVYEKAFAKWKTNDLGDEPNYGPIAGGWPVQATTELTNLPGVTKTCSAMTADDIWNAVRANCVSMRTVNPMTAWTFCVSPSPVNYTGTGIYGYHAYTILGWAFVNNIRYIVLRNPWGHNGPVIDSLAGSWAAYDQTFWRSVPLNSGGVFAIPVDTFKKYYWQFGWNK